MKRFGIARGPEPDQELAEEIFQLVQEYEDGHLDQGWKAHREAIEQIITCLVACAAVINVFQIKRRQPTQNELLDVSRAFAQEIARIASRDDGYEPMDELFNPN